MHLRDVLRFCRNGTLDKSYSPAFAGTFRVSTHIISDPIGVFRLRWRTCVGRAAGAARHRCPAASRARPAAKPRPATSSSSCAPGQPAPCRIRIRVAPALETRDTSRRRPSMSSPSSRPRPRSTRASVCSSTRSLCASATQRTTEPSAFVLLATRRYMPTSMPVDHCRCTPNTGAACVHVSEPLECEK